MTNTQADLTERARELAAELYITATVMPRHEAIQAIADVIQSEREAAAAEARKALEESVKLQSHYARLLNDYDGGQRMTFASADEWIARLAALASPAPQEP